jgi:energy-coupling factor transporter ATP-binding protein EcfA2
VLWIEDEDALPLWEHTSPLRGAARWWSTVQGAAMVHAGAVADGEHCVLLVGDSGAGKSTTTMACHGSGLDVLGDDFCFVEPPTDTTPPIGHTMYRLAKLDERALDLLPHLRPRVVGTAWRGKQLIDLAPGELPPRPIVAICHVTQDTTSPTHTAAMSRIEALRAVAPSTIFQQRLWERETWQVLAATVRATQCHRLSVNDLAEVPDVIRSILEVTPRSDGDRPARP